jgi:hypothetical protein
MRKLLARSLVGLASALVATTFAFSGAATADPPPPSCPTGVSAINVKTYTVNHPDGTTTTGSTLAAAGVRAGDTVTVAFRLKAGCSNEQFSLASYRAPTYPYDRERAPEQELYSSQTGYFNTGTWNYLTVRVPTPPGTPGPDCPNSFHDNSGGKGANASGPYDTTCDGSASRNGNGDGNANGKPCAGCVGNADNKNPKGQMPDAKRDGNNGYECDNNNGVGKSNPAHSGCTTNSYFQVDFVRGAVLTTLGPSNTTNYYGDQGRLIDHVEG